MNTEYTFDYDLFSDLHKDAYGYRPRYHRFYDDATTDAERQEFWDMTLRDLDIAIKEEEERKASAIASFEKAIAESMAMCNCDRATAIRYQIEAGGWEYEWDAGYICYHLGLPYNKGYEDEFRPFIGKERAA